MTRPSAARAPSVGDRQFLLDSACVALSSVAICAFSQQLATMTLITLGILVGRLALFAKLPAAERDLSPRQEGLFFAVCTLLGAVNDWNSVTRHRIYDYTVPVELPELSLIPLWMLLYWGLILRYVSSLFRWSRLAIPAARDALVWRRPLPGGVLLRVGLMLAVVLATRQAIYRTYLDPLWSWLPFALAIAVCLLLLRPERRRLWVLVAFASLGPAVEVLYIQVGNLHAYHLGWLFGVPLWIALWWVLAALIWGELSARMLAWLAPRA